MPFSPHIKNLEIYAQHPNGCGLASLLMLLDIRHNPEIGQFLSKTWKLIKNLYIEYENDPKEYRWAITLQYILLKSISYGDRPKLYSFLEKRLQYGFEDARIINKYTQDITYQALMQQQHIQKARFFLDYNEVYGFISPIVLLKNLHTMKTDIELKILAELFNLKFVYQESEDLTGAIYFSGSELSQGISDITKSKWETLENWSNKPDTIILYGQNHHWLAICGIYRLSQLKKNQIEEELEISKNKTPIEEENTKIENDQPNEMDLNQNNSMVKNLAKLSILQQIKIIFNGKDQNNPEMNKESWNSHEMIIDLNDPAMSKHIRLNFAHLSESDRFYIFQKRSNSDFKIFKTLLRYTSEDVKEENKRWESFLSLEKKNNDSKMEESSETDEEINSKDKNLKKIETKIPENKFDQ